MLTPSAPDGHPQASLFGEDLLLQLDPRDPLLCLAQAIPWARFDEAFAGHYSQEAGRPAIPVRVMVGLLLLKQLENLSDEQVVLQCKRNPYYQAFCGFKDFQRAEPCHATELVHFRQRIGEAGIEQIFHMSVALHGKAIEEKEVHIDSTVQEKHITYPTDGKLAIKIINRLHKLAKAEAIQQRRTYVKEVKQMRLSLRFFRHVTTAWTQEVECCLEQASKKRKKATKAMKRLRTIARTLMRELERKLPAAVLADCQADFALYERVLSQQKNDQHQIYSLHEPQVYCLAKGKDHKTYEYGAKATMVSTAKRGIILAAVSHPENKHDSHCLEEVLAATGQVRKKAPARAICDRGYRGKKQIGDTAIILPGTPLKRDTRYQRDIKRQRCRRRAAIEPLMGHLKSDFRLSRNFLKGTLGDSLNLLLAACAWNLRKWLLALFWALKKGDNSQMSWPVGRILSCLTLCRSWLCARTAGARL